MPNLAGIPINVLDALPVIQSGFSSNSGRMVMLP